METDYSDLDVDQIVKEVYAAKTEGRTRPATKQELMRIRLAALSAIVRNLQDIVEKDHELVSASRAEK
jgi:nicotinamide riboside kinase